jgi:hypothetical protein
MAYPTLASTKERHDPMVVHFGRPLLPLVAAPIENTSPLMSQCEYN